MRLPRWGRLFAYWSALVIISYHVRGASNELPMDLSLVTMLEEAQVAAHGSFSSTGSSKEDTNKLYNLREEVSITSTSRPIAAWMMAASERLSPPPEVVPGPPRLYRRGSSDLPLRDALAPMLSMGYRNRKCLRTAHLVDALPKVLAAGSATGDLD